MVRWTCLVVLCVASVLPQRAFADPKVESKQHFDAASEAHKQGKFSDALNELMVAYALDPRPELLYAIGQIHVKLGQCPMAITFYERFIATKPKPEHVARAEKAIEICKTNPPPPEAQTANPEQPREDLGLAASENLRKAKEAEALAATEHRKAEEARIAAERKREQEKLYNRHPMRKWAIVAGGVGVGSLIAGGVFAVSARNAQSAFDNAGCGTRTIRLTADTLSQCESDAARGEQRARLANVFLGAGAAVAATALIIFIVDPGNLERPEAPRAAITLSPTSIQFTARW